ncbi:hypothetical protein Sango_0799200 [Sesamum angolense]|uniref:CCHC-type domain-containing protein n=1 Tax=Sesamum angolense TaxID=2727404 RepID=A0AAE1X356_9LAMI|nr:hypothetical protein Sango_0799200 [Sesamum angolense]
MGGNRLHDDSVDGSGLTLSNVIRLESSRMRISWGSPWTRMIMSKNPLSKILDNNKFNGTNYTDWLRHLRIVLNYENQGYIMDKSLPQTLRDGSSSEERETFERCHADHRKVRSIILACMSNDVQKQYDRLDDVALILQHMKEVYAITDRHTRYVATKEFFRAKMTEGSSVQEHGIKMLSLVEKFEDLKARLDNDMYINVILQPLHLSYDPFIVNFIMNGLEKSINELINMLVKYEATIKKSAPLVLIGEASTSKAKDKRAGCWKRKKGKAKAKTVVIAKDAKSAPIAPVGMGKGKRRMGTQHQSRANDICALCRKKGHWKRDCPNLSLNQGMFVVEVLQRSRKLSKDEVVLRLGDGKAVAAEVVGIINLVISDHDEEVGGLKESRIDNLDNLPAYVSCQKGKMTRKLFVGQSTLANDLLARLLNIAPSKTVAQMSYQIWHDKPASYKYLGVWGSSTYVKRLVGDKLDSRSSLYRLIGYRK